MVFKSKVYIRYYDDEKDAWIDQRVVLTHKYKLSDIKIIEKCINKALQTNLVKDESFITRIGVIFSNSAYNKREWIYNNVGESGDEYNRIK